jgi:hypothetical protein
MRLVAFFIALVAWLDVSWAFHEIESYDRAIQGGGHNQFFTGSPRFKGYDCRICHTGSEGRIKAEIAVNRAELLEGVYEANTGYTFIVTLVGEHRGLDSAFNPNTFTFEIVNDMGESVGDYILGEGPLALANERRVVAAEGIGEGETQWSFTWFSPREGLGPLTFYLAMVDGDGAGEKELRWIDPLNDDVAIVRQRLCPKGQTCQEPETPDPPVSPVHCSSGSSGSAATLLLLGAFLLLGLGQARRSSYCNRSATPR